jgi:GT2 family glycosyltransferase
LAKPQENPASPCTAACVVNYNGEQYLPACLDALLKSQTTFSEIIVVDNASSDNSLGILRESYPEIRVIALNNNHGPPAARNAAYVASSAQRVLFIDNDVAIDPNCVELLNAALDKDPEAAVAMPRVIYAHQRDTIQYDGAGCHPIGLMYLQNANSPLANAPNVTQRMGSVVTACILVDRLRLNMPKPFDESFFFNYEDHDFGIRVSVAGNYNLSVPAAHCYHGLGTQGLSYRPAGEYSQQRAYYLIRNRWQILLKNYQLKTLMLLSPVLVLYELLQFPGAIKKGWIVPWLHSVGWIFIHLPQIFRKRKVVQQTRQCKDADYFVAGDNIFSPDLANSRPEKIVLQLLSHSIDRYWKWIKPLI